QDSAGAAGWHVWDQGAGEVEYGCEVDGDVHLPGFERLLPKRRGGAGDARVVHEDVNVARPGENFLGSPVDRVRIGDVGLDRKPTVADLRGGPFGAGSVDIDDRHDSARLCQPARDRFSYACSPTRYHRALAPHTAPSPPPLPP